MAFRLFADAVLVFHLLFVAFAVAGGLFALRWRWMPWLHLPVLGWAALVEFTGWICPLTPLENRLRRMGGEQGYPGGFIEHYILPVLYPDALTREMQFVLGAGLVLVNAVVYWVVWRKKR